jgi:hypothetical protein
MAGELIYDVIRFVKGEKDLTIHCRKSYKQLSVKRNRKPTYTVYYLETSVSQIHLVDEIFLLPKSDPPRII